MVIFNLCLVRILKPVIWKISNDRKIYRNLVIFLCVRMTIAEFSVIYKLGNISIRHNLPGDRLIVFKYFKTLRLKNNWMECDVRVTFLLPIVWNILHSERCSINCARDELRLHISRRSEATMMSWYDLFKRHITSELKDTNGRKLGQGLRGDIS